MIERALFECVPKLRGRVPWVALGDFPTAVEPLDEVATAIGCIGAPLYAKRDDRSANAYGGNKVRTLEVLFGAAKERGCTRIYSTGAYGSNHALATAIHARSAGLEPGAILFPQPSSEAAAENLRALISTRPSLHAIAHWSVLPFAIRAVERREHAYVMVPGGATAEGALGYVSAALELAQQVERGEFPAPRTVLVGVGSTCTSAGLLVGLRLASVLGIGWREPPDLVSVRVTPWPVTARFRIVGLAMRTATQVAAKTGERRFLFDRELLASRLEVDGRQLGRGYGHATAAGREAIEVFAGDRGFALDTTYSAKSAAAAIARTRAGLRGPLVYWATKSTRPLPVATPDDLRAAPPRMVRWLAAQR